jgi:hypothetical protein
MSAKRKKGEAPEWRKHVEYEQRGSNGYWKCKCSPLCAKAGQAVAGGLGTWVEHMLGPVPGAGVQVRGLPIDMCTRETGHCVCWRGVFGGRSS